MQYIEEVKIVKRKSSYSTKKTILAVLAVITLAFAVFYAFQSPSTQTENVGSNVNIGQVAQPFSIQTIDNDIITSENLKGKPTVLWFMAAWCPSCAYQAEDLKQIKQSFGNRVNIVAIDLWVSSTIDAWKDRGADPSTSESANELRAFRDRFGGNWIWALDTDEVTFKYNIVVVDSTIILNEDWEIIYKRGGPTGFDDLFEVIKGVL